MIGCGSALVEHFPLIVFRSAKYRKEVVIMNILNISGY